MYMLNVSCNFQQTYGVLYSMKNMAPFMGRIAWQAKKYLNRKLWQINWVTLPSKAGKFVQLQSKQFCSREKETFDQHVTAILCNNFQWTKRTFPPRKRVVSFKMVKLFTDRLKLNAVTHAHESYVKNSFVRNKFLCKRNVVKDSNRAFFGKFITSRQRRDLIVWLRPFFMFTICCIHELFSENWPPRVGQGRTPWPKQWPTPWPTPRFVATPVDWSQPNYKKKKYN